MSNGKQLIRIFVTRLEMSFALFIVQLPCIATEIADQLQSI